MKKRPTLDDATPTPLDTPMSADLTPTPVPDAPVSSDLTPASPVSAAPSTPPSADEPRFVPGTVLDGRYRIIGLLGRGGMGEVYRADDLKLGQSVALKFLPLGLENDPERLQRFLGEVKVALRVTHPNVCRVYDIGEVDGAHYLSMEYIDGEDLSSLLRRIGRLPEDKAIDIARQLCSGLAAAHEQGILHRDLKPANVMLDGRGDVRITDFGLAGLADGFTGLEIRAGTPAFMAPEQLAGKEVTVKSDIYSLGLVLYELFTGKRAFQGRSSAEISALQQTGPASPTSHVTMLDPTVEQVILRCLEADPAKRPSSVLKVAMGLPGGDPLAAALAAGETPSPEMVAESGGDSGLEPKLAVPIMISCILGLLICSWIIGRYHLLGVAKPELPPQVLAHRAQEIAESLGYDQVADRESGFAVDWDQLRHLNKDLDPEKWDRLATDRPTAIYMWYRQSRQTMIPHNASGQVVFNDPPVRFSGMVNIQLDTSGRLSFFKAVPPQFDDSVAVDTPPDWDVAFAAAGLQREDFAETSPQWLPEAYCNERRAWTGTYPEQPDSEIRVESCAYNGKLVFFSLLDPWVRPFRQEEPERTTTQQIQRVLAGVLSAAVLIGAVLLVRRNLRLGRGDRVGAFRVGVWVVAARVLAWVFQGSHVSDANNQIFIFSKVLGSAMWDGLLIALFYIALEPFVRRRWPKSLISWNRLLAGRFRDPLVGRHVLYGAALGIGAELLRLLGDQVPTLFGEAGAMPKGTDLDTLMGTRWVLGEVFFSFRHVVYQPMTFLFILVVLRALLRNRWLALAAFVAVPTFLAWPDQPYVEIWALTEIVTLGLAGYFMMRFGLVAFMAAFFFGSELLSNQPLTLDFSTWYAGSSLIALAAGIGIILAAFQTSLAGKPVFADDG